MQHLPHIDPDLVKRILLPALAGAAGTGAVSAYISQNQKPEDETPQDRRHRIMRNAMMGAALGGVAGGALPTGLSMLGQPFSDSGPVKAPFLDRITDKGLNAVASHGAALGTGAVGGGALYRSMLHNRGKAVDELSHAINGTVPRDQRINPSVLRSNLSSPDGVRDTLISHLKATEGKGPSPFNKLFHANALVQEAGHKGMSLDEMKNTFQAVPGMESDVHGAYGDFLASQGPVSKLVSNFARMTDRMPGLDLKSKFQPLANLAEKSPMLNQALDHVADFRPASLAEGYGSLIRPSVGKALNRVPMLAMAGLVGAGALGAQKLQNRLSGN